MNSNPYAPPTAAVEPALVPASAHAAPFFAVSILKLTVLSICSLGLYELYWFYKNWQCIRDRERSDIVPALRTFFAVLFCYSCFKRISEHGRALGVEPPLAAGANAAGWIVLSVMWRLPDPYWWVCMLAIVFLIPVQTYVNRINAAVAPDHDRNDRFTLSSWITLVVGGLLLLLALIGSFLPES